MTHSTACQARLFSDLKPVCTAGPVRGVSATVCVHHEVQPALVRLSKRWFSCALHVWQSLTLRARRCRPCELEQRLEQGERSFVEWVDTSSVPTAPLTLPTLAAAMVMCDGTVINSAEDFLRATRLSRFSKALLEDGGMVLSDIPNVNSTQLELAGIENDLQRKRFLRESAAAFPLSFTHEQAQPQSNPRALWRVHIEAVGVKDEVMPSGDLASQLEWLFVHCNRAMRRDEDDLVDVVLFSAALGCTLAHRATQRPMGRLRQIYMDLIERVQELSLRGAAEPVDSAPSDEGLSTWFDRYLDPLGTQASPLQLKPEQQRKLLLEPEPEPDAQASRIECSWRSDVEIASTIPRTDQPGRVASDSSIMPMIRARQWDWMIDTLKATRNPIDCASQTERTTGKLPLHLAILKGAPYAPIQALVSAYPDACRRKDDERRLPLHCALLCESSAAVVQHLLEVYPEGCLVPDPVGVLPLQCSMLRARSRLQAATTILKQDLHNLQLSALIARASQGPDGGNVSVPDIDFGASKQAQREAIIAHLIDSDLVLRRIQHDDVVAALSTVVDSLSRAALPSLHPEAYEHKDGQLGGVSDGERSSHALLDAMARCTSLTWAVGFTYRGVATPSPTELLDCIFFRTIDLTSSQRLARAGEWHTYLKVVPETLSPSMDQWARMRKDKARAKLKKQRDKTQHRPISVVSTI